MSAAVRLLGIRHHGPGSARAVRLALDTDPPDLVLIEAPSDLDPILPLVGHPEMEPPVAALGHVVDRPERAVFVPFASFSPEWVAIEWAVAHHVPVRSIDLALRHVLAEPDRPEQQRLEQHLAERDVGVGQPVDPIGDLAAAAGYDDPERWWEDVVEHRGGGVDPLALFDAIGEAMTAVRAVTDPTFDPVDPFERRREAAMRTAVRQALAEGVDRVAVVCGAWHVPALARPDEPALARADRATLRGLPKAKVAVTWVPWTHRRLAGATGYGAGVTAPGWYDHLFRHHGPDVVARWFTEAARILRDADRTVSAADVVEATRLAESLAALRDRPLAGLAEVDDAARAVLGRGGDEPMRLLSADLVVGRRIGHVPASTPMVPLARDLGARQRRCRLTPSSVPKTLELDLRKPIDLARSHLLHRLDLLDVPWGVETEGRASAGTFRETWVLRWEPELEIRLIEAAALGTTVVAAATSATVGRIERADTFADLTSLAERALLADLTEAVPVVLDAVGARAALDHDVVELVDGLVPLARSLRYGDVRGTDAEALAEVVRTMSVRIAAGLPSAATGLDGDGSRMLADRIRQARSALALLGDHGHLDRLHRGLAEIAERDRVHGVLQGLATRVLADAGEMTADAVAGRVARALSPATDAVDAAGFVEGFLDGAGAVLVHDPSLLALLDDWVASIDAAAFVETLPLVRRTFSSFEPAERRAIGERVRRGTSAAPDLDDEWLDPERVAAGLETVALLLGRGR